MVLGVTWPVRDDSLMSDAHLLEERRHLAGVDGLGRLVATVGVDVDQEVPGPVG